tara:strand:+ start:227 stop:475 length:249 start_codon:yes stop_codon:yes gene_type:complete
VIWIIVILLVVAFLAGVIEAEKRNEEYFKAAEDKPSMSTKNWEQHQRRLNKFGESKYRDRHFYVGPKGGVYYISYTGTKVYC